MTCWKNGRKIHFVSLQSVPGRSGARLVTGLEGSQRSFLIAALFAETSAASLF